MIFHKAIAAIDWADIEGLVQHDQQEAENLDYKRELPGRTDGDKKEFLADLSSFANGNGGFIVFGIDERIEDGNKTGRPDRIVPLTANHVTEIPRLEQVLTTGVTPRIPEVQMRAIVKPGGSETVVIIKIGKSWIGPHMVTFDQQNKFFIRKQNGKFPMDYLQIRDGFLQAGSMQENIRDFCNQREQALLDQVTPLPITNPQSLLLHVVPIATFGKSIATATELKNDGQAVDQPEVFVPLLSTDFFISQPL